MAQPPQKTVALAAGGTGGHMFPAESLAEEMKQRGWKVVLFTDERGLRYANDFPSDHTIQLPAANPYQGGIAGKVSAVAALGRALLIARRAMRLYQPDIVVGFGGYPSAPAMFAARLLGVPRGVHEQNAVLGRVNRFVARSADFVAHAFPVLERLPESVHGEVLETGNPVREVVRAKSPAMFASPGAREKLSIFVFGGSQGASLFSRVVPKAIAALPEALRSSVRVTQQAREQEIAEIEQTYDAAGISAQLRPFFTDMPDRLADAHLIIARSGASSVTEIATIGRAAILVPLGIAMDDHQTGNARVLTACHGAKLIPEPEFTADRLSAMLSELLTAPGRLEQMAANALSVAPEGAVQKLADLTERMAALGRN